MDKTLHKKLTEKHPFAHKQAGSQMGGDDFFAILRHEKRILDALATDLLQPRPEAIANILKLAKTV